MAGHKVKAAIGLKLRRVALQGKKPNYHCKGLNSLSSLHLRKGFKLDKSHAPGVFFIYIAVTVIAQAFQYFFRERINSLSGFLITMKVVRMLFDSKSSVFLPKKRDIAVD